MAQLKSFNLLIAGVGGQGVVGLTKTIWRTATQEKHPCRGSIFKGGAQSLGTVYSVIRIFEDVSAQEHFSHSLLPGDLDLLIGLEAWEALRYVHFCNRTTKMIVNEKVIPFWSERHEGAPKMDPLQKLKDLKQPFFSADFLTTAKKSDLGFEMAKKAIELGWLPIDLNIFKAQFQPVAEVPALPVAQGNHSD